MTHTYKEGEYAHYLVGSDTYPLQIIEVSSNGKTVRAIQIQWRLKPSNNKFAYLERQTIDDVEITGTNGNILTFKSRKNQPHKEPGKYGATLRPGFSAYRDPHV